MKYIGKKGQIRVAYHAIGLRNAGQPAELEHDEDEERVVRSCHSNATGDFQEQTDGNLPESVRSGELFKNKPGQKIPQIKYDHITSQFCNTLDA